MVGSEEKAFLEGALVANGSPESHVIINIKPPPVPYISI